MEEAFRKEVLRYVPPSLPPSLPPSFPLPMLSTSRQPRIHHISLYLAWPSLALLPPTFLALLFIHSHPSLPPSLPPFLFPSLPRWEADYPQQWAELMDMCDEAAATKQATIGVVRREGGREGGNDEQGRVLVSVSVGTSTIPFLSSSDIPAHSPPFLPPSLPSTTPGGSLKRARRERRDREASQRNRETREGEEPADLHAHAGQDGGLGGGMEGGREGSTRDQAQVGRERGGREGRREAGGEIGSSCHAVPSFSLTHLPSLPSLPPSPSRPAQGHPAPPRLLALLP